MKSSDYEAPYCVVFLSLCHFFPLSSKYFLQYPVPTLKLWSSSTLKYPFPGWETAMVCQNDCIVINLAHTYKIQCNSLLCHYKLPLSLWLISSSQPLKVNCSLFLYASGLTDQTLVLPLQIVFCILLLLNQNIRTSLQFKGFISCLIFSWSLLMRQKHSFLCIHL